uniref:PWWP domain-containing protein n=1 Tax=Knipowitschia caucasica TaxID=637954 RepID=A0AAV2JF05_KNICA
MSGPRRDRSVMSAASSLKHVYGFSKRESAPSPSPATSSFPPLRRLQSLTGRVSQQDSLQAPRQPDQTWEWPRSKESKADGKYSWKKEESAGLKPNQMRIGNTHNEMRIGNTHNEMRIGNAHNEMRIGNTHNEMRIGNAHNEMRIGNTHNEMRIGNTHNEMRIGNTHNEMRIGNTHNEMRIGNTHNEMRIGNAHNEMRIGNTHNEGVSFSGPPSPAFSLDSNSPFDNGFLQFESSLFEDDDGSCSEPHTEDPRENGEHRESLEEGGGAEAALEEGGGAEVALGEGGGAEAAVKVVTRSQSSGQRRRYWDASDDEWESDSELFLFADSPLRNALSTQSKTLAPVKYFEGEVVWAKLSRRPWWPCEVRADPSQGCYHREKESSDRPCRLYYIRTFGENAEELWLEDKFIHIFHGGYQFDQLHRGKGKHKDKSKKNIIAKRFLDSWSCSVVEAESILEERSNMASSFFSALDDVPAARSQSPELEALPASSDLSPADSSPLNIGSITFPNESSLSSKTSTLTKTSGTKKSKSKLKITSSLEHDSGECPYCDLDSAHRSRPIENGVLEQPVQLKDKREPPVQLKDKREPPVQLKDKREPPVQLKEKVQEPFASNRLMTRAFEAMEDTEQQKEVEKSKKKHSNSPRNMVKDGHSSTWKPETNLDFCSDLESVENCCNDGYSSRSVSPVSSTSSNANDLEADVKSEEEGVLISSIPPADFVPLTSRVSMKKGEQDTQASSPFSFMSALTDVDEVSFQSVSDTSDGKAVTFKADANYKFSTFLMMIKDLHDTREKDGAPLELEIGPPSAHIKEEPMVMPPVEIANQDVKEVEESQSPKKLYLKKTSSVWVKKKSKGGRCGPGVPGIRSGADQREDRDFVVHLPEKHKTWECVQKEVEDTGPQVNGEKRTSLIIKITGDKTQEGHKRIRKPSKRLIEWTEEYDQIFSNRKKTKKLSTDKEQTSPDSEQPSSQNSCVFPEMQTPPPEEPLATAAPELQLPHAENSSSQNAPVISVDTLTPPPETEPAPTEAGKDSEGNSVLEKKRKRKPTQKILEYCLEAEAAPSLKKKTPPQH